MGVLDSFWTGRYELRKDGSLRPIERNFTLSDVDNPEEWWELSSKSKLAKRIKMLYPFIEPIVDDNGQLVDIRSEEKTETATTDSTLEQEALARGYQKNRKLRPKKLMPFLNAINVKEGE